MDASESTHEARQRWGLFVGALVFLLFLLIPPPPGLALIGWRTAAVGILMSIWWMTEALPIPATALLPLVFFPFFEIGSIQDAAAPYANPLIFLFMSGFIIALAMERWNLHRRIALNIIKRVGTKPTRLIAGFMIAAAFLSMWISNTATALMMLPVGMSVIALVRSSDIKKENLNFPIVLMLGIAYACSIGGVGTLIGTPTNAFYAGFMLDTYGLEVSTAEWILIGLPLVVVGLSLSFLLLTRFIYPIRIQSIPGGRAFIEQEVRELGPMARSEKSVAWVFAVVAALWMFRPQLADFIPAISDAGIAMAGALSLFMIPVDWKKGLFVMNWEWARKLPWGVLILFGGGLSLAFAIRSSGLADWIGNEMSGISTWPIIWMILLVVLVVIFLTELSSNTATAAAFLPVLASLAVGIGQNPLLLLIPATLASSCAFMLPVATPPNAIVYGSEEVTIPLMAKAGFVLNIVFVGIITLAAYTLLPLVFGVEFGILPDWIQ